MSKETHIQYADSTGNLQMGCDGCELWNRKTNVRRCYAGVMTDRYAGRKGWPVDFEQPTIFPERFAKITRWKDLTGTDRPDKPWLNGCSRVVFLNDMGDTFTDGLDLMWMEPYMPALVESPHIYILLTKRPKRLVAFFEELGYLPPNWWLLTSITSQANVGRALDLLMLKEIYPDATIGMSLAPLWSRVDLTPVIRYFDWAITEGESGDTDAKPSHPEWFRDVRDTCATNGVPFFHKQNGAYLHESQVTAEMQALIDGGVDIGVKKTRKWIDGSRSYYTGRNGGGRLLDGRQWNQMPAWRNLRGGK